MSAALCAYHDDARSVERCFSCDKTLCSSCSTFSGTYTVCPPCFRKARRTRALGIGIAVLTIVAAGSAAAYGISQYEPPFDYGTHHADIARLTKQLEKEPCDRSKTLKLS